MRIYIIGNDGITLCGEPPAVVDEGEIVVASNAELQAAQLSGSLATFEVDDEALSEPAYQEAILASVREAAGASFDDLAEPRSTGEWCG